MRVQNEEMKKLIENLNDKNPNLKENVGGKEEEKKINSEDIKK